MFAIGTAMYQGSFLARVPMPPDGLFEHTVVEAAVAPKGMYEYYLNLAGYPNLLLDLSDVDLSTPGAEWLEGEKGFRLNGTVVGSVEFPDRSYLITSLLDEFDALIFIRDSTPSMPLILVGD